MTYVLQFANEPDSSYSEHLIKSLRFMMTNHNLKKSPGLHRPGAVFVSSSDSGEVVNEGEHIDSVSALMGELVDQPNEESDLRTIVRAAMGHLNLVMIHPFRDGKGRQGCSRVLYLRAV